MVNLYVQNATRTHKASVHHINMIIAAIHATAGNASRDCISWRSFMWRQVSHLLY